MNSWKAILAALVIFTAGIFTGGALIRKWAPAPAPALNESVNDAPFLPREVKEDYVRWLAKELHLSKEQTAKITEDIGESQQRIRILFEFVGPEMREEMQQVRDSIKAVLTPEQQTKYEELRKRRSRRSPDPAADAQPKPAGE